MGTMSLHQALTGRTAGAPIRHPGMPAQRSRSLQLQAPASASGQDAGLLLAHEIPAAVAPCLEPPAHHPAWHKARTTPVRVIYSHSIVICEKIFIYINMITDNLR